METLPGIVIDDSMAQFKGNWTTTKLIPNIGGSAQISGRQAGAEARFPFKVPATGKYEVRLYWAGHENRASNTLCKIERPSQEAVIVRVNQKETSANGANSLGIFEFKVGAANAIILAASDADGNVVADAVQIVAVP
jgi:hypothetical protein